MKLWIRYLKQLVKKSGRRVCIANRGEQLSLNRFQQQGIYTGVESSIHNLSLNSFFQFLKLFLIFIVHLYASIMGLCFWSKRRTVRTFTTHYLVQLLHQSDFKTTDIKITSIVLIRADLWKQMISFIVYLLINDDTYLYITTRDTDVVM